MSQNIWIKCNLNLFRVEFYSVVANDRSGLLRDITTILANEKVNVLGVASRSDTKQQLATIDMTIEIYNLQVLGRVLGKLNQVPDVIDARRLHGS